MINRLQVCNKFVMGQCYETKLSMLKFYLDHISDYNEKKNKEEN